MFPTEKDNPLEIFQAWLEKAKAHKEIHEPTAMCLATASKEGVPSARMVLLKGVDERGFVFYTNLGSLKARQLLENPHASLCFFWQPLHWQVRAEVKAELVGKEEADAYFKSRPRQSRLGAWVSKQGQTMRDVEITQVSAEAASLGQTFEDGDIPRPEFWSGFRLVPHAIEFWQQGDFRLHDRIVFTRDGEGWQARRLYP